MSLYEPSSPDSDSQCFSPGSCDDDTSSRKFLGVNKNKRLKASARERRRRHVLNDALESLRRKVSSVHSQNPHKLSKIEVLRLAIDYIAMLSYYLDATASPYYAQDDTGSTLQQQQHIFAQYTGMVPHSSDLVENFNKDAQMQPVQSTNRAEFDVYLRGYGNL